MKKCLLLYALCCLLFNVTVVHAKGQNWQKFEQHLLDLLRKKRTHDLVSLERLLTLADHAQGVNFILTQMKNHEPNSDAGRALLAALQKYKSADAVQAASKWMSRQRIRKHQVFRALVQMPLTDLEAQLRKRVEMAPLRLNLPFIQVALRRLSEIPNLSPATAKSIINKAKPGNPRYLRILALEAMAMVGDYRVAEVIMQCWDDPEIGDRVNNALRRLTGNNCWNDRKLWQEYLTEQGENLEIANLTPTAFHKIVEQEKALEKKEGKIAFSDGSFYGIPVSGENILFVLDNSGSMGSSFSYNQQERKSSLDHLKGQLKEMIQDMVDRMSMDRTLSYAVQLIFFNTEYDVFPHARPISPAQNGQNKINKFLDKIEPTGSTNMKAAWEEVINRSKKRQIDTIYFLTDGHSSDCTDEELLNLVNDWNVTHGAVIHCVALGSASELLANLAAENYGTYFCVK